MVFRIRCVLVLRMKVALALEVLKLEGIMLYLSYFMFQVCELSEVVQERSDIGSLVLRNADINDEGMRKLAMSLTSTASELKMLNLNLNKITPEGAVHVMDIIQHKKNIEMLL